MGVPAFFRWLSNHYPRIVRSVNEEEAGKDINFDFSSTNPNGFEVDNLYLDMNGIVHPCCHPEGKKEPETLSEMMHEIFKYTDRLLSMVRPRKVLFFAVDGVAPRAKLNQQRSRRFRSAKEAVEKANKKAEVIDELKLQGLYEEAIEKDPFDSNCVTPGTSFMLHLSKSLKLYIAHRLSTNPAWKNLKVIFSDSNVPGEGEHKIMDYIRNQRKYPSYNPNQVHVIYGLDADLIMLSLSTHEPNFFVLREDVFFDDKFKNACYKCGEQGHVASACVAVLKEDSTKPFILLDNSLLREYLEVEFKEQKRSSDYDLERLIDDWIFLIFFVGNDFLPHLPSLEIREGAIDMLVEIYKSRFIELGGYLTRNGDINFERTLIILNEMGRREDEIFRKRKDREERRKRFQDSNQLAEAEDDVRFWESGYKLRYYQEKFGESLQTMDFVSKVAVSYLEGLLWVLKYYYQGCPSWNWYFPFHYAPFASDFTWANCLKFEFQLGKPFKPYEQLLAVLPAASKIHIPEAFHELMEDPKSEIIDFYPESFRIDLNGKKFAWQGVAILPFIEEDRLIAAASKLYDQLEEEEKLMNVIGEELLFVSSQTATADCIMKMYESGSAEFDLMALAKENGGMGGRLLPYSHSILPGEFYESHLEEIGIESFENQSISAILNCLQPNKPFVTGLLPRAQLPPRRLGDEDFNFVQQGGGNMSRQPNNYHSMHKEANQAVANREAAMRLKHSGLSSSFIRDPSLHSSNSGNVFNKFHKRTNPF